MPTKPNASLPPLPPKTREKGTTLEQLKIRQREQAALQKARTVPHPPPPPPPPPQAPPPPAHEEPPDGNLLELMFARALRNRADTKPANDPGMAMLQALSHQVQTGQPIKAIENVVVPHLGEMPAKVHLFLTALAYHNMFERGALLALARWTLEKSLWDDLIGQKLSPVEKLALLQLAIKESDKVQSNLTNFQGSSDGSTGGDIEASTEKADRPLHRAVDPTDKHLEGTSPVGRELARRLLDKAGKNADKIVAEALKRRSPT